MLYAALLLNEVLEVSPADSTLNIHMFVAPKNCCSFDSLEALAKSHPTLGWCLKSQYSKDRLKDVHICVSS